MSNIDARRPYKAAVRWFMDGHIPDLEKTIRVEHTGLSDSDCLSICSDLKDEYLIEIEQDLEEEESLEELFYQLTILYQTLHGLSVDVEKAEHMKVSLVEEFRMYG